MRLLFLGDVMGRSGRAAIVERLPGLREAWALDFVVVNVENASNGAGCTEAHARAILAAGADVLTLGDHAFDQRDMMGFAADPRILRPLNFARGAPGRGAALYDTPKGRVAVVQVLGQVFMKRPFDDPFSALDAALRPYPRGGLAAAVIVDVHAEATSEKMALGHWLDGRASLVAGTHTHVPTADATVLPKGAGYVTDAGMCGDYDSVIGMQKEEPMRRFVTGMPGGRFEPARGEATLCGLFVETDAQGRALRAVPVRQGGRLAPSGPEA
jgi:metallophosphoesterase (TIGR00282 family)